MTYLLEIYDADDVITGEFDYETEEKALKLFHDAWREFPLVENIILKSITLNGEEKIIRTGRLN